MFIGRSLTIGFTGAGAGDRINHVRLAPALYQVLPHFRRAAGGGLPEHTPWNVPAISI
jgi:hypothetical protein